LFHLDINNTHPLQVLRRPRELAAGWRVEMRDGVPWWTPPAWQDPDQRPRRNTVHHLDHIVFRQPAAA